MRFLTPKALVSWTCVVHIVRVSPRSLRFSIYWQSWQHWVPGGGWWCTESCGLLKEADLTTLEVHFLPPWTPPSATYCIAPTVALPHWALALCAWGQESHLDNFCTPRDQHTVWHTATYTLLDWREMVRGKCLVRVGRSLVTGRWGTISTN